ncbi:IgG-binding virulence factor TspB family protein [Neisseria sp. HMSC063B05]|uniref:IgG-binding virulence factor TspB family protein n=2 Tax=unclassified Neisseria TaxID=2623750 RepID=UPI00201EDD53|nr:IgG-binding virulence factor TspB family protein [Neisseria sp. HMSC063B05]
MMKILQRLFITVVILLGFNFSFADVDIHVEKNGRMRVPAGGFNQNGIRPWMYLDNNGPKFHHEYVSRFDKSLHVREASTGLRSVSTVPVTLEARVSRKAVLSGAFGLVKAGAKIALKAAPYVGAASYAYDAYQAVKSPLESEGYKWNEVSEEFLKEWPARNCIWVRDENNVVHKVSCYGVDSSVLSAYRKGGKSQREAEELMKGQMEKLAGPFWEKEKIALDKRSNSKFWEYYHLDECRFNLNGGNCSVKRGGDGRSPISFTLYMRDTEVLTQEKFLQIATPSIDGNPTPFVEGTGKPEYQENIKVPAGTVVTIGPVTPENGKPVQITITFGKDSNGNTTAEVATTQRPDLTPGGSEAPNTKPDPDPAPNPDGKPDKKPDDKPDSDDKPDKRPDDKPDPDDDPSDKDKDKRKEDKKDDKKEESKGLLCDFFPDILACDKMGKPEEGMFDAISIPQTTDDRTWSSDDFLPPNGVCPQPKSFNIWGKPVQISYEPLCVFMEKVRFAVLLGFIIMSAFIVFGSLRK